MWDPFKTCRKKKARLFYPEVAINAPEDNLHKDLPTNKISSTKYTIITFFPKNLYEQFRRITNIYFLVIAIVSLIPAISPFSPATTWGPLIFVLAVSAIKDAIEDIARWRSDNTVNNRQVEVLREGKFVKLPNKDIVVGDIVCVNRDEEAPADAVILCTSDPDGIAFVDTANLDGETNLKPYKARPETKSLSRKQVKSFKAKVSATVNNPNLYKFQGNLEILGGDSTEKLALDEKNLLLRGARLRNTKECYAGVVYAGFESKVQLNANNPPSKFAETEKIINRVVLTIFSFKITACTGCAIANFLFEQQYGALGAWTYLPQDYTPVYRGFLTFWSYFALFSYFIPISLIVTLEVAKLAQAIFMMWDVQMVNEDGEGMTVKNSNLNDELARVGYIFCDKTGTLTENRMIFDKASIDGVAYTNARNKQLYKVLKQWKRRSMMPSGSATSVAKPTPPSETSASMSNITPVDEGTAAKVLDFVLLLAATNTAQAEYYNPEEEAELKKNKKKKKKSKKKKTDEPEVVEETEEQKKAKRTSLRYQAQSPDEICLCNFAHDNGVTLKERRNTEIVIDVLGEEKIFKVLQVMEFTSDRRRMSVILETPEGQIVVYSKGADSIMMARLSSKVDSKMKETTQQHIDEFSLEGLRTLICGKKVLTKEQYEAFAKKYNAALALIEGRDAKVDMLADAMERDFDLVGCTAIEDKLQDGVPEAIAYFIAGGIKVWIITGDKQATAINIAKSCNLIQQGVTMVIVNASSDEECNNSLDEALKVVDSVSRVALVIDGPSLPFAFSCGSKLLAVSRKCEAVVVCRATPLQKALVVRMIKRGTDELTLSIGDGANDVSMIQEAHIGVGIYGKEGSQAARSADYAIYMYKHLKRLVCIHGRYNLLRSSALIQFCFYKNLALFLVQLWFSFFNGFSSQPMYESFMMAVYNVIITVAPPFFIGVFERDVRERTLERFPEAHRQIRAGEGSFTYKNFLGWVISAIYHSLVIFWLPFWAWWPVTTTSPSGRDTDFWEYGTTTFIGGFLTVIFKIALFSQWFQVIVHLGMWGSVVVYFGLFWILSSMPSTFQDILQLFYQFWSNPNSVFLVILVPLIALLPDFLYYTIRRNYFPRDHHILQELDFADDDERHAAMKVIDESTKVHLESKHIQPPDLATIRRTHYIDDLPSDTRMADIAQQEHAEETARQIAENEDSDDEDLQQALHEVPPKNRSKPSTTAVARSSNEPAEASTHLDEEPSEEASDSGRMD